MSKNLSDNPLVKFVTADWKKECKSPKSADFVQKWWLECTSKYILNSVNTYLINFIFQYVLYDNTLFEYGHFECCILYQQGTMA